MTENSMFEVAEMSLEPYTELTVLIAMLDCEMQRCQSKIQCITEENVKQEMTINEYKGKIQRLEKAIDDSREKESKIMNNIDTLRTSRLIFDGLISSTKQEIQTLRDKRLETKKTRDGILDKYTHIFQSYRETYRSLPWIQENRDLKIKIEAGKIHLNILKSEFSSYKRKISLFDKICDQRLKVAILKLAKLMVDKNYLEKDIKKIDFEIIEFENKIKSLKIEEVKAQEKLDLRVKAAVAEARERAVKAQSSIGSFKNTTLPSPLAKSSGKESIFQRLGIGGPLTLKRLPLSVRPVLVPQKIPRFQEVPVTPPPCLPENVTTNEKSCQPEALKENKFSKPKEDEAVIGAAPAQEENQNSSPSPSQKPSEDQQVLEQPKIISPEKEIPVKKMPKKSSVSTKKDKKTEKRVTFSDQLKKGKNGKPKIKEKVKESPKDAQIVHPSDPVPPVQNEVEPMEIETPPEPIKIIEEPRSTPDDLGNLVDTSIDSDSLLSMNLEATPSSIDTANRNTDSPDFLQKPQGYCFSPTFGGNASPQKGGQSMPDFLSSMSPLFSSDKPKTSEAQSGAFLNFFGSSSPKKKDDSAQSFFQLFG